MDRARNEYDTEYELTCPPGINTAGDGLRRGLAWIDDYYETDVILYIRITFQEGPMVGRTGGEALSRPRSVASKSNAVQIIKARPEISHNFPR